jgi:hypothetical protein
MDRAYRPGGSTLVAQQQDEAAPVAGRTTLVQCKRELPGGGELHGPARDAEATGGGEALPAAVRTKMEASFGADFSAVRVHQGPQAQQFGALAFARGDQIFFQPGRYQPETAAGQELLGHELAHVVQQRGGRVDGAQGKGGVNADAGLEAEADAHGAKAARGEAVGSGRGGAARGDGPVQMKALTGLQMAALRPNTRGGGWRWVSSTVSGGHVTIFLDAASAAWVLQQNIGRTGDNYLRTDQLNGRALTYDELHYTNANGQHYYYSDAGDPRAASVATGAASPVWADAGWAAANRRVAAVLGIDADAIDQRLAAHRPPPVQQPAQGAQPGALAIPRGMRPRQIPRAPVTPPKAAEKRKLEVTADTEVQGEEKLARKDDGPPPDPGAGGLGGPGLGGPGNGDPGLGGGILVGQ